jgi:acyl carrier protein
MTAEDKESIFRTVTGMIVKMLGDWEYSGEIRLDTLLVSDLGFESLDIVVLGETIQKHYARNLPFTQFYAELGQREARDIRVGEFVEFICQHLNHC